MLHHLKSTLRKLIAQLTGRFDHIKLEINSKTRWYGNQYGGFFACPDNLKEDSIIYSFGIGEDISFDTDMIKYHNCNVFGFDPTPKSINWVKSSKDQIPSKFVFHEYGISEKSGIRNFYLPKDSLHVSGSLVNQSNVDENNQINVELKFLDDIALALGHQKIDVLKMDIEGAEYQVIESIANSELKINQILIEFHERFFQDGKSKTINAINILRRHGYKIFAISDSYEEVSFMKE